MKCCRKFFFYKKRDVLFVSLFLNYETWPRLCNLEFKVNKSEQLSLLSRAFLTSFARQEYYQAKVI